MGNSGCSSFLQGPKPPFLDQTHGELGPRCGTLEKDGWGLWININFSSPSWAQALLPQETLSRSVLTAVLEELWSSCGTMGVVFLIQPVKELASGGEDVSCRSKPGHVAGVTGRAFGFYDHGQTWGNEESWRMMTPLWEREARASLLKGLLIYWEKLLSKFIRIWDQSLKRSGETGWI